jgi:hypothetical protein
LTVAIKLGFSGRSTAPIHKACAGIARGQEAKAAAEAKKKQKRKK